MRRHSRRLYTSRPFRAGQVATPIHCPRPSDTVHRSDPACGSLARQACGGVRTSSCAGSVMSEIQRTPVGHVGRLATGANLSRSFYRTFFQDSPYRQDLASVGALWEAVRLAWSLGNTGKGRRIAVLDSGFDLEIPELQQRILKNSLIHRKNSNRRGKHGSVVALLIREVAPDCELLLIDIIPGRDVRRSNVAKAIEAALAERVDIINLSLEFRSSAELRLPEVNSLMELTDPDVPAETILRNLRAYQKLGGEPYLDNGCRSGCPVCETIKSAPANVQFVAASGNNSFECCPASATRVTGVGFHQENSVEIEGRLVTQGIGSARAYAAGAIRDISARTTGPMGYELCCTPAVRIARLGRRARRTYRSGKPEESVLSGLHICRGGPVGDRRRGGPTG